MKTSNKSIFACIVLGLAAIAAVGTHIPVLAQEQSAPKPATMEFYYKVKWGYFDEFYELFRRNHYPILRRLQETGHILEMSAAFPVHHQGENDRWDMRVTVVYADPKYVYEYVYGPALVEELYPDQALFKKEEKRRFELLLEHKDVAVRVDNMSDWRGD